ncbi:UNC93-like protein MFSD11 [Orbicella faveolata]|uniref:UNC93-like protein MFSD11 n=1 Tax=Orbicella faveolata TaxID=48498 RepID=UPI0009E57401|nr:UNC93-like protein MFSD11 [Orbicella faveolata]
MAVDVGMWNVLVMGFAFMFMFTAFQTTTMIEPTVLQSFRNSTNKDEKIDGYVSLGIIYAVFTVANWLAPSFVGLFGPRVSMIVGGICYAFWVSIAYYIETCSFTQGLFSYYFHELPLLCFQPTVLQSFRNSTNKDEKIDGYVSLGIIYAVFTVANWLAPSFVGLFGPRVSMIVGGICYALFIASLIQPKAWSVYLGSVVIGYGASVIWTGQGNFLTINSTPETISRNSGIFWALLQCSLLFGNMYVYFQFKDESQTISDSVRRTVYTVFTTVCGLGICLLFLLRKPRDLTSHGDENGDEELSQSISLGDSVRRTVYTVFTTVCGLGICLLFLLRKPRDLTSHGDENGDEELSQSIRRSSGTTGRRTALESFKIAVKIFFTKDMLLLSLCFAYTGIELTFFSGVYGTCVGNTKKFEHSKRQIGLVGMFIGCGEIIGGLLFGIFGKRSNKFGRDPIVLFGAAVHWICFLLIFLNIPDNTPKTATTASAGSYHVFSEPNLQVAMLCGFLLGLGDSSFNTQIYSILGSLYGDDSAPAFALFKFVQSLTAAIAFFYSLKLVLKWQLLILVISSFFGTIGFFLVEWKVRRTARQGYLPIAS